MNKLYTIFEVATKLGISDKTLRRWEEAGKFRSSRTLGNQRRYSLEDLQILDAIKHGTIASRDDLLTVEQASHLAGVSPATFVRWENEGKIHPFITAGNTYYPRQRLMEKLTALEHSTPPAEPTPAPSFSPPSFSRPAFTPPTSFTPPTPTPRPPTLSGEARKAHLFANLDLRPILANLFMTIVLILGYHLIFNSNSAPISPVPNPQTGTGSVQGTTTQDPRVDILEKKLLDHLADELLKDSSVTPATTINLGNTAILNGKASMPAGQNQISITHASLTSSSIITATPTSDYAPAKKYWISPNQGSFTIHTDFPVSAPTSFNYSFLVAESTASASTTP